MFHSDISNIKIRFISGEIKEKESTLAFLVSVVNHNMNKEIWKWEFESFPGQCVLSILADKNATIATQFMLPVNLNLNELIVLSGKCENSYMDTAYRGKGIV